MPRYIDAEKLAEHKFPSVAYDRYVSDGRRKSDEEVYAYKVGYNEAIASIEQFAPTADVVEVVRCKDCKHSRLITSPPDVHLADEGNIECRLIGLNEVMKPTDFCSYGEMRDDG